MSAPINTAILSFGMSGKVFHAPFIHANDNFHFYAVWERSKKAAADIYPGVKSFDTLEALLQDTAIELVIVNTPNATHYNYAKQCLLAGKHVLVEKPFVVEVEEGEELIEIAKEKQLSLGVYHNRRFDSDFNLVKQVIVDGLIGNVAEAEIHYDRFKQELSPKVHKETPGPGAGILYDLGSHLIDQALQLFGTPEAIFADVEIIRPISKVDDYFELIFYYPQKRVRLKASNLVREAIPAFVVHGSKGSFIKQRADVQEEDLIQGKIPNTEGWGIEPADAAGFLHTENEQRPVKKKLEAPKGNYMLYFDMLYKAIREGGELPVTAEDALQVIKVIKAAFQSVEQKSIIVL